MDREIDQLTWKMVDLRPDGNEPGTIVTFVGHATTCIQMDGTAVVTDPLLRDRLWHLRRDEPCVEDGCLPVDELSAVMISHLHMDHADVSSLRRIPTNVPVIAPSGTGGYLRTRLSQTVHTIDEWESYSLGSVDVIRVPAAHRGPGSSLAPLSASAGYIVRGTSTVYFAGDTALFDGMQELGEAFDIDLALLPVWGYGPNLRGDHMTPRDAAQALTMLRPRLAVPIHWGTFRPLGKMWSRLLYFNDPPYTFAGYATQMAPNAQVHILQPGESLAFSTFET
jgi:L-ascorbate metabolism protein UlaG (beta-lactamase superfamily)